MPLVIDEQQGRIGALPEPAAERPRPSALYTLDAAARQSNLAGALYDVGSDGISRPNHVIPDYDALDDIAGYEDLAHRFYDSSSPEETSYIKQRIALEHQDRQTLSDAGGWGLAASLAFGVTDPTTLLSMAIPATAPTRAGMLTRTLAAQIGLDSAAEAAFHGMQETRTPVESVINVGAGAFLTGVIGSAVLSRIPKAEFERVVREADTDLTAPNSTAGASAVARTTREQETIAAGGETIAETLGKVSPGDRLLTSPSVAARRLVQELAETPEVMTKNAQGIITPTAVETLLKRQQGKWWQAYQARREAYADYRNRVRAEGGDPLSRKKFGEEVSYAMRRGDESVIPEVSTAAKQTRSLVFEPYKARAEKAGLLPEDVKVTGADSYLMRQYNVAKIRREMSKWLETLEDGFIRQGVDPEDAGDLAHQATRNIMGTERGTLDLKVMDDIAPKSGRLKERTIKLPDDVLEPWLVNDIDNLSQAYLRTIGPEVELTERFGDRNLDDAITKVKEEYGVYKSRATTDRNDALLKTLQKREEGDIRDILAMRDRLYGHFGAPKEPGSFFVRAGRMVRVVNYTRLLGGQVISAMTDVAKLLMMYGAPKMVSSALKLATNIKALKLARNEARRMGIGLDLVLNTRGIALGDIGEYSSYAEQAIARKVSDAFSVASLQSPWNAVMKSWASVMSQDDILAAAKKIASGDSIAKRKVERFASIGLDDEMLRRIGGEFEAHGQADGLKFGMSEKWKDQEAARAFESAVLKEADMAVLTPGAGDLPLVYSTEWGKALLQFKSFSLSSVRRLQIPAAQGFARGDLATMTGVMSSFGLGAMVYALKQVAADQPIETDPKRFAMEMVDKSGLMAWSGDLVFPALWQLGADDLSRWSDRQPVETMLGPVAGTIGDLYSQRLPQKIMAGELSEADVHKLRRLLPGQNLFYIRRAINALEEEAAEAIDAR
jgi:hypothetical protein